MGCTEGDAIRAVFLADLETFHMFFLVSEISKPWQSRSKMKVLLKNNLKATGKENIRNRSKVSPEHPEGWGRTPRIPLKLFWGGP